MVSRFPALGLYFMTLNKRASASHTHSSLDASLRMAASALTRPPVLDGNSSDESSHLVGELLEDGIADLRPAKVEAHEHAVNGTEPILKLNNSDDVDTEARLRAASGSSDENYDALKIDPTTVVQGGKGGGLESTATLDTPLRFSPISDGEYASASESSPSTANAKSPNLLERRKSISIKLEKTGTKGRYILKAADEPELKELLRFWVQREADGPDKKRRSIFSDLVFTRQFTAFDRQNPTSASSPFLGFFTLFWLGTFLLLVKIAASNWKIHGSIFGRNEIMRMMFHRDVLVLGLTDGVMCASTAFCLILQKAILAGYLTWNRHGWILQNVRKAFHCGGCLHELKKLVVGLIILKRKIGREVLLVIPFFSSRLPCNLS